ncbi:nitroreductase family protein [Actinobaculum massiliense]|uniref:nitroreductase family protein n=1 Tax=Actinobaculum massiliense TaxID=202789 RepID=UPI002889BFCF|nr:nitroreductase family protein [Actinobaculum massiliense]
MDTNETIAKQLDHRTIRQFTDEPIPVATLQALEAVANRTATSQGLQHSSVIRITDQTVAEKIAQVSTQQYIAEAPELWIFVVDTRRAWRIAREKGHSGQAATSYDAFTAAFTDACLMAQNVAVAAESLGLGTCFIGSIGNDTEKVLEALQMPELTYPVLALIMGYPAEKPELKPRMPAKLRIYENSSEEPESWSAALADYDARRAEWVDTRYGKPVGPFTDDIARRMDSIPARREENLRVIAAQGFDVAVAE